MSSGQCLNHWGLIFAARITLANISISAAMRAANSFGVVRDHVVAKGSEPLLHVRLREDFGALAVKDRDNLRRGAGGNKDAHPTIARWAAFTSVSSLFIVSFGP